jgi:hypothetical protein
MRVQSANLLQAPWIGTRAWRMRYAALATLLVALSLSAMSALADDLKVTLGGNNEVPPVNTMATGGGTISINPDMSVSGGITTKGVAATMAHIHLGAAGANGPVIVGLVKSGDNGWQVPAGSKLTEEQYRAYKAGDLYVNVHSAEHKGGEIRAQLTPAPAAMPAKGSSY